jgi:hypothetical protein
MTILINNPATVRVYIVIARIARSVEHRIRIDQQRDTRLKMKRRRKKNISLARSVEFDRLAGCAMIDRLLNPLSIQTPFVRVAQHTVRSGEPGLQFRADRRNVRFHNRPPVLRRKVCRK